MERSPHPYLLILIIVSNSLSLVFRSPVGLLLIVVVVITVVILILPVFVVILSVVLVVGDVEALLDNNFNMISTLARRSAPTWRIYSLVYIV